MSWPSIWQNQNQTQNPSVANQQNIPAVNAMYLTPDQQQYMQQQSWQQWQIYNQQMAQWQAQYGDQVSAQAILPNVFMQNTMPPPLPMEQRPPPPPPPKQENAQQSTVKQEQPIKNDMTQPPPALSAQTTTDTSVGPTSSSVFESKSFTQEQLVSNFDNNRRGYQDDNYESVQQNQNSRNNRNWIQNNRGNWNQDQSRNVNPNEFKPIVKIDPNQKSQEEIDFEEQYRVWEEDFERWKRDNSNHTDRRRYNDFVKQMEICRESMLKKREFLRKKRLNDLGISDTSNPAPSSMKQETNKDYDDIKMQHPTSTAPLFGSSGVSSSGGIPGLDLVHGGNKMQNIKMEPKPELRNESIASSINQMLDDPNIKSILSNFQKQKQFENEPPQRDHFDEDDRFPKNMNTFRHQSSSSCTNAQRNPFRNNESFQNTRDDFNTHQADVNREGNDNPFGQRSIKRERSWDNDNNDANQRFGQFQRDDKTFDRNELQSQNQNSRNNYKRPRNDDQSYFNDSYQNDSDEFRPVQVFDYQNQRQNERLNQNQNQNQNADQNIPSFVQQPTYVGSRLLQLHSEDGFPRKVYDYNHKSKILKVKEFCPAIQIEYDHQKKGFSLHEHPPPKRVEQPRNETAYKPPYGPKGEFLQLRQQPKWESRHNPRQQQQHPYTGQNQMPYKQRYDDERYDYRKNRPGCFLPPLDKQTVFRKSQPERNRQHMPIKREYGDVKQEYDDSYKYDRYSEPTASSSSYQPPVAIKVEENPKIDVKQLLFPPGRKIRPQKIVILMRGPPGSGKSFVARIIKDKESEMNGSARILSIDDYFTTEVDEESTLPNGKKVQSRKMSYEYEAEMEDQYMQSLLKLFKKTLTDGFFHLLIVDCNNITLQYLPEFYSISLMHQYTPYVCEMPLNEEKCIKNNIHNRSVNDIKKAITTWVRTPSNYTLLQYDSLFNDADATEAISDIEDEKTDSLDAVSDEDDNGEGKSKTDNAFSDIDDDDDGSDECVLNEFGVFKSKWDNDSTENKLARLDGTNKPMKHTIEDFLQEDGWEPPPSSTNGKKRVRWADIEEKREQEKQRAIGFIVGQTNWNNLIGQPRDHRDGTTALTKIKYIEKVKKK